MKKERVVKTRGVQDVEKLINQMTKGKPFYTVNWEEKRNLDCNGSLGDLANVLATLLNDLKTKGII